MLISPRRWRRTACANIVLGVVSLTLIRLERVAGIYGATDGLAKTPPMGWRSWNTYGREVTQEKMIKVVDAFKDTSRVAYGKHMSLLDFGYADIGLDDNW